MRIRQIKPGWWLDKDLRRGLSAEAREFYIGLWMLADDSGYLDWDVERIAAELYPYDGTRSRERHVVAWTEALTSLVPDDPHLVVMECGHARVPKLAEHQRFGGRPVFTVRDAHARDCARPRADARPGRVGNGIGTVGNGTVDRAHAPEWGAARDDDTPGKAAARAAVSELPAAAGGRR